MKVSVFLFIALIALESSPFSQEFTAGQYQEDYIQAWKLTDRWQGNL